MIAAASAAPVKGSGRPFRVRFGPRRHVVVLGQIQPGGDGVLVVESGRAGSFVSWAREGGRRQPWNLAFASRLAGSGRFVGEAHLVDVDAQDELFPTRTRGKSVPACSAVTTVAAGTSNPSLATIDRGAVVAKAAGGCRRMRRRSTDRRRVCRCRSSAWSVIARLTAAPGDLDPIARRIF